MIKNILKNEKAQGVLEFALILPIFIFIIFTIIDFTWFAYQSHSINYSYQKAGWEISLNEIGDNDDLEDIPSIKTITGSLASKIIKDRISNSADGIISSNLEIENGKFTLHNERFNFKLPDRNNEILYGSRTNRYLQINADIIYYIKPLTYVGKIFFGNSYEIKRKLDRKIIAKVQQRT